MVEERDYRCPLNLRDMIYESHYRLARNTGSPGGSRDSLSSTGGGYNIPRAKRQKVIGYQRLEHANVEDAVILEMAHMKDKCFCDKEELKDRNNLLALSPTLHKMFDGNRQKVPTVLVTINSVDLEHPPREKTEVSGRKEFLYKVQLRVQYTSVEVAVASTIRFKDKTIEIESDMGYFVEVEVKDPEAFPTYINWKANDTRNKCNPQPEGVVLHGDEDSDGDDEEG